MLGLVDARVAGRPVQCTWTGTTPVYTACQTGPWHGGLAAGAGIICLLFGWFFFGDVRKVARVESICVFWLFFTKNPTARPVCMYIDVPWQD